MTQQEDVVTLVIPKALHCALTLGVVGIVAGIEKRSKTSKFIILPCNYYSVLDDSLCILLWFTSDFSIFGVGP
jgi:hypothetical protein